MSFADTGQAGMGVLVPGAEAIEALAPGAAGVLVCPMHALSPDGAARGRDTGWSGTSSGSSPSPRASSTSSGGRDLAVASLGGLGAWKARGTPQPADAVRVPVVDGRERARSRSRHDDASRRDFKMLRYRDEEYLSAWPASALSVVAPERGGDGVGPLKTISRMLPAWGSIAYWTQ
jgi:hypothetical protein